MPESRMRISELAKRSGVSVATIKHYVNEGLLPKPVKTGKTMAYYGPSCVERVQLIKRLQREKFMPLDVIKMMIEPGSAAAEDLEFGQAMVKTHRPTAAGRAISERKIEEYTGFPLDKIQLLENHGLIMPTSVDKGKQYDAADCQIIEVFKKREALGIPFDYSVETMKIYRNAMQKAQEEDVQRFVRDFLGDIPAEQATKFMVEGDDSLDTFLVLIRQKISQSISQGAVKQAIHLRGTLKLLNFLPVSGRQLPAKAPSSAGLRAFYFFCAGDYQAAIDLEQRHPQAKGKPEFAAAAILARILAGETAGALQRATRCIPTPTGWPLENAVAGLAHLFAAVETPGFSKPIYLIKRAIGYFRRIEIAPREGTLIDLLSLYVCGAAYIMMPELFGTRDDGIRILLRVDKTIRAGSFSHGRLPSWYLQTLEHEMLPNAEIRLNRFLAMGSIEKKDWDRALGALERMIVMAHPGSEDADWARMERLRLGNMTAAKGSLR